MFTKMISFTTEIISSIGEMKISGAPKAIIYILLFQLIALISLYIIGLIYKFFSTGILDFTATNNIIKTLVSADFIAAILIIGKGLIDKDNDGTPDCFQEKEPQHDYERGEEHHGID